MTEFILMSYMALQDFVGMRVSTVGLVIWLYFVFQKTMSFSFMLTIPLLLTALFGCFRNMLGWADLWVITGLSYLSGFETLWTITLAAISTSVFYSMGLCRASIPYLGILLVHWLLLRSFL